MSDARRSAGRFVPLAWAAARVVCWFGFTYWPALFWSCASPSPWLRAVCSALIPTYAMLPGVALACCTMPGLPLAVSSPGTAGQVTVVPRDGPLFQSLLVALRNAVKMNVSPEASTRRMGTIVWDGRLTPGFSFVICWSFHLLIL